jgi:Flp pilus assembly secretin CpaC
MPMVDDRLARTFVELADGSSLYQVGLVIK